MRSCSVFTEGSILRTGSYNNLFIYLFVLIPDVLPASLVYEAIIIVYF